MPARRILQLGDPLLRAVSARVLTAAEAEPVFADLRDTLHEFQRAHGFGRGVRVHYEEEDGRPGVLEAEGPFSELLQHEIDHLDGVLAIDRALDRNSLCTREEWQRRYARAQGSGS